MRRDGGKRYFKSKTTHVWDETALARPDTGFRGPHKKNKTNPSPRGDPFLGGALPLTTSHSSQSREEGSHENEKCLRLNATAAANRSKTLAFPDPLLSRQHGPTSSFHLEGREGGAQPLGAQLAQRREGPEVGQRYRRTKIN